MALSKAMLEGADDEKIEDPENDESEETDEGDDFEIQEINNNLKPTAAATVETLVDKPPAKRLSIFGRMQS